MDIQSYKNVYIKFINNINILVTNNVNSSEISEYIDNILEEKINNFINIGTKNSSKEKDTIIKNYYGYIKDI